MRGALLALALAACGHPGSSGPSSPGSGTQAPGSGSEMAGAGSGSEMAGSGSATPTPTQQAETECEVKKCGPRMGMPSRQCKDGSMGGPTGRCLQHADGTCGWEVKACPP